jgi:hypothetical protein
MKVASERVSLARRLLRLVPGQKPQLELRPSVTKVKATSAISVQVAMRGVDRVELELEPKGTFTLDRGALEQDGEVRLLGKMDGKATLIATGMRRGQDVVQRLLHVECDGPLVRILAYGYVPGSARRG